MTVRILFFCLLALAFANPNSPRYNDGYSDKVKTFQLHVPGRDPITIIESAPQLESNRKWEEISIDANKERQDNLMKTDVIHDSQRPEKPRCFGPSCQEGFVEHEGPQEEVDDYYNIENADKVNSKDFRDFSKDRLEAINALAEKLKIDRIKGNQFNFAGEEGEYDDDRKVFTSWNKLNVKQHKHPFEDKDGWVTLEPVAWSTSKISKWKPTVKKQKPYNWNKDEDRFPDEDNNNYPSSSYQGMNDNSYNNYPPKRPSSPRPMFINNKLHLTPEYESEIPSRPTWNKPQSNSHYDFHSSWSQDEGRRPYKPSCDSHEHADSEDSMYHSTSMSDSILTDVRPSNFPYDYEALHQGTTNKRPIRRPSQVVYAGSPDYDSDRKPHPTFNDGQWVLLSTTKGYRNKKRQRSLNPPENPNTSTMTSHQAVALTVLPVEINSKNMTTSHGGLLEVEKTFKTVEESKRDMERRHDLEVASANRKPTGHKTIRRKVISNSSPDSSTLFAAVGAGMVPATMAMVVPMMFGRRRRRRDLHTTNYLNLDNFYK